MIHWDWVFTVWFITFPSLIASGAVTAITAPLTEKKMLAEADLIRAKMEREKAERIYKAQRAS